MNIDRLQLMVTMLREVAAGTWKASTRPSFPSSQPSNEVVFNIHTWVRSDTNGCGFAACAVGHACLDQRFIDQGLHERSGLPHFEPPVQDTEWYPGNDWRAVRKFFDIDTVVADWLFSGCNYLDEGIDPTPENVALRIEGEIAEFLKEQAAADDQLLENLEP